jgi:hypothetical protein
MSSTFYKKYFEIQLYHESNPGVICESFGITPSRACIRYFNDHGLGYKNQPGSILVYYSGIEVPPISSPPGRNIQLIPANPVPDGTEFFFIIDVLNPEIFNKTAVPDTIDLTTYFPPGNNYAPGDAYTDKPVPIPWTFIKPAIAELQFADGASANLVETLTVSKLSVSLVDGSIASTTVLTQAAYKTDSPPDGSFYCSVDMSPQESGAYTFQLGSDTQQYYVDVEGETMGSYGVFRLIKDLALLSPPDDDNWAEPSPPLSPPYIAIDSQNCHVFQYTFPATVFPPPE